LSPHAERLFWRIVVKADDYGLYFGATKIVKSNCLPLLADAIKDITFEKWMSELEAAKQIFRYTSKTDGKVYLKVTNWEEHQQTRATKPKFPLPEDDEIICKQLLSDDNGCSSRSAGAPHTAYRIPNNELRITDTEDEGYGEFKNVLLTGAEISKLQADVPSWQQYIEDLSAYMASKGAKYKSHYATIRQWASRDKKEGKQRAAPPKETPYERKKRVLEEQIRTELEAQGHGDNGGNKTAGAGDSRLLPGGKA
jgi:hypothetical protein